MKDTCITIAAGTAIGINGAAMGVSYLYERKSRAAPYAALSMTAFGVMTVVFSSVEPFRGALVKAASR
jgi:putative effector of murein hydrolase